MVVLKISIIPPRIIWHQTLGCQGYQQVIFVQMRFKISYLWVYIFANVGPWLWNWINTCDVSKCLSTENSMSNLAMDFPLYLQEQRNPKMSSFAPKTRDRNFSRSKQGITEPILSLRILIHYASALRKQLCIYGIVLRVNYKESEHQILMTALSLVACNHPLKGLNKKSQSACCVLLGMMNNSLEVIQNRNLWQWWR